MPVENGWLVEPMAKAAVAAGANGLMIEVHNNPEMALCDGSQSLKPAKYDALLKQVADIAKVVGKTFLTIQDPVRGSDVFTGVKERRGLSAWIIC